MAHKGKKRRTAAGIAQIKSSGRKRGVARTIGMRTTIHANLAAPVFGHAGKLELVITVIGVRGAFNAAFNGPPARKLAAVAKRVSRDLGGDAKDGPATP